MHRRDHSGLRHGELRRAAFAPLAAFLDPGGEARAFEQILDRDLALRALVLALDDDAWAPRLSAYFICAFIPASPTYISERMPAVAQFARHFLIVAYPGFIHDQHHDGRAPDGLPRNLAEIR